MSWFRRRERREKVSIFAFDGGRADGGLSLIDGKEAVMARQQEAKNPWTEFEAYVDRQGCVVIRKDNKIIAKVILDTTGKQLLLETNPEQRAWIAVRQQSSKGTFPWRPED